MKGYYKISSYPAGTIKFKKKTIKNKDGKKLMKFTITNKEEMKKIKPLHQKIFTNKVISKDGYGVNNILRNLFGDTTYQLEVDEVCFGNGAGTPNENDDAMFNETVSGITFTDVTVTGKNAIIDIFVPSASMPNDTYTELALKANGRLFTHSAMNYAKGANQDTTLEYVVSATV